MHKGKDHNRADGTAAAPVLTRSGRMALEERARHCRLYDGLAGYRRSLDREARTGQGRRLATYRDLLDQMKSHAPPDFLEQIINEMREQQPPPRAEEADT